MPLDWKFWVVIGNGAFWLLVFFILALCELFQVWEKKV